MNLHYKVRVSTASTRRLLAITIACGGCEATEPVASQPQASDSTGPHAETGSSSTGSGSTASETMGNTTATSSAASSTEALEPTLELGTGQLRWEPLEEGGVLELVAGPQGGWHVDVALRAADVDPDGAMLRYEAVWFETREPLSYETLATLSADNVVWTDTGWERVGDRVVFDIEDPEVVVNQTVCIVLELQSMTFTGDDERCALVVDLEP